MTLYMMSTVVFTLSATIYEIFTINACMTPTCPLERAKVRRTRTTSYMMTIIMLALSLIICEILANQNFKYLTLKIKVSVKEMKSEICVIRLEIFESILFFLS